MPQFSHEGKLYNLPEGTSPDQAMKMILAVKTEGWPPAAHKPGTPPPDRPALPSSMSWIIPPEVQAQRDREAIELRRRETTPEQAATVVPVIQSELRRKAPLSGEQRAFLRNELKMFQALMTPPER